MPLANGELFAGYRILRLLGSGGMGEVYLAEHPRLPKRDALKVLRADVSADPDYRARFEREADLASTLWHPHIVGVHDRGEVNGQLWISMDYVDGTDAAHLLRERYPYGMPIEEAVEIVSAIADALDYAHERQLLHRDVKPANILIAESLADERRILLADFGIARSANDTGGLTATNVTVGSIGYAAPEQLRGAQLDGRADQYALACTAFHLLTGAPPFKNSNPAVVIGNHLSSPPPRLATLRPDLAAIDAMLTRAMAKEPSQRFPTCRAFAKALAEAAASMNRTSEATQFAVTPAPPLTQTPQPPNYPPTISPSTPRRRLLVAAGVVALLAVGIVAFVGARLGQPQSAPQSRPTTAPGPQQTLTASAPPVTVTQPGRPSTTTSQVSPPGSRGDLGLPQPMSTPACNGQGIVILGSVTTPGLYAAGVQRLLDANPGAFYLRTDQTCPSLRQATNGGNPIYAVFELGGSTRAEVCAAVRAAGGDAYGKWLDTTTDPDYIIPC